MTQETYESILSTIRATPETPAEFAVNCKPDNEEILLDDLKTLVSAIPEELQNDETYFASERLLRFIKHHAGR